MEEMSNSSFFMSMKKVVGILIGVILVSIIGIVILYFNNIGPVDKNNLEMKEFTVLKGNTYLSLASSLKEQNLIQSELFYKIYVKLNNPKEIQAGKYSLSSSMSVKEIISEFEKGSTYNPDIVTFTIPEGKHLEDVAFIVSSITNHTQEELLTLWNSEEFINEVIENYWFVTEEVKQDKIQNSLEGYFFPSTYELMNKDVDGKSIAYKMLDQMDKVLSDYKEQIEKSEYSVHELLTLASIVEHEAILDEDRPIIAGVFYNRLANGWKLQSCATIGYAIDEWKLTYSKADLAVDSPYNTYLYYGLPIGPGNMPGRKSIEAVMNPDENEYFFFLANVCDTENQKTYFSKTLQEHNALKAKYLTCF